MNSAKEETTANQDTETIDIIPIDPPDDFRTSIKKPMKLILDVAFLVVIFIPTIIWSIIKYFLARRKSVKGKVVLVTGSGRGLGRGYVEAFARLGCKIACVDVDPDLNQQSVKELKERYPKSCIKAYECNVALPADVKALKEAVIKDFGQVNIVVHNAGIVGGSNMFDFDDIFLLGVINVNLTSHFFMIREFLPEMLERNEGHYVAMGSVGSFNALKGASMYVAAKHGLFGLMNCLQRELEANSNNRIQSSIVCPYFVNTSALYTSHWKLRMPELSIEETVEAAVDGILKNRKVITIPSHIYYVSMALKLLPENFTHIFSRVFYVSVWMPSKERQLQTPLYQHLIKSAKNFELTVKNGTLS